MVQEALYFAKSIINTTFAMTYACFARGKDTI